MEEKCFCHFNGYEVKDAFARNYAKKIGNPHNLLDNSDFRNPVNQRGQTYYNYNYNIDRWTAPVTGDIYLTENGIKFVGVNNGGYGTQNRQHIVNYKSGKMYTFAVCDSDGEITIVSAIPNESWTQKQMSWGSIDFLDYNGVLTVNIKVMNGYTKTFWWAALYEGEYTEETLPEYKPKGYGAELAECLRYYQKAVRINAMHTTDSYFAVSYMHRMRIAPTVTPQQFDFYGKGSIEDFTGCEFGVENSQLQYAYLPTIVSSSDWESGFMGALTVDLNADL